MREQCQNNTSSWPSYHCELSYLSTHDKQRKRTAVCAVICVHPTIFAPFKGLSPWARFRNAIRPGISRWIINYNSQYTQQAKLIYTSLYKRHTIDHHTKIHSLLIHCKKLEQEIKLVWQKAASPCTQITRDPGSHLIHCSLGQHKSSSETKLHVDQVSPAHCILSLYFTMGQDMPTKTALSTRAIWARTKYMVPRAHLSPQPKQHLDRFIRFCRAHACVQQIDRHTYKHTTLHR